MEERELLRILETAFIHLKKDVNYKETKRRYQQALEEIAALIKKPQITEKEADKLFDDIDQVHYYVDRKRKFKQTLKEISNRVA